jgi:hypothetical protein
VHMLVFSSMLKQLSATAICTGEPSRKQPRRSRTQAMPRNAQRSQNLDDDGFEDYSGFDRPGSEQDAEDNDDAGDDEEPPSGSDASHGAHPRLPFVCFCVLRCVRSKEAGPLWDSVHACARTVALSALPLSGKDAPQGTLSATDVWQALSPG